MYEFHRELYYRDYNGNGYQDDYYYGGQIDSCKDDPLCDYPAVDSGANFETNCDWEMTNFNLIMMTLTWCRNCVIYPTFQDGELTGDVYYGYQDEGLINQCWKFWSHNAYWCDSVCMKIAAAQVSLLLHS